MFGGGMDPQAALAKLLSFMVFQGFAPKLDGLKGGGQPLDDAAKLADALKQLQGKEGLPQTGKLDEKSLKALEKYKPATTPGERATERQSAPAEKQAASRLAASFRDQSLAAWIKNKSADLAKPPATQNPVTQSSESSQSQAASRNQETQTTQAQLNQQNVAHDTTKASTMADVDPRNLPPDPKATRDTGAMKASESGKGQQGQGEEGKGKMGKAGQGSGKAEELPGGRSDDEEGLARGDADQLTAFEDGRGNQATGDEDEEDERRGAALVDDGSGVDEGAYEVPSVAEQLREALAGLVMEVDTDPNRPTTYRGEFVFYKPGVYQSRTQAPQLLNMKVDKATAYDDVWTQVVGQINARLRVFEPGAAAINTDHIVTALQLARARGTVD
jgi:hypothetical protein